MDEQRHEHPSTGHPSAPGSNPPELQLISEERRRALREELLRGAQPMGPPDDFAIGDFEPGEFEEFLRIIESL